MKKKLRAFFQIAVVVGFAILLWRLFPYVAAFGEGVALSIRRFWWLILLIAMGIWLSWVLSNRHPK